MEHGSYEIIGKSDALPPSQVASNVPQGLVVMPLTQDFAGALAHGLCPDSHAEGVRESFGEDVEVDASCVLEDSVVVCCSLGATDGYVSFDVIDVWDASVLARDVWERYLGFDNISPANFPAHSRADECCADILSRLSRKSLDLLLSVLDACDKTWVRVALTQVLAKDGRACTQSNNSEWFLVRRPWLRCDR